MCQISCTLICILEEGTRRWLGYSQEFGLPPIARCTLSFPLCPLIQTYSRCIQQYSRKGYIWLPTNRSLRSLIPTMPHSTNIFLLYLKIQSKMLHLAPTQGGAIRRKKRRPLGFRKERPATWRPGVSRPLCDLATLATHDVLHPSASFLKRTKYF